MTRVTLALMAVVVWVALAQNNYSVPPGLEDHLWLVLLLPAVYLLCISLLRE